MYRNNLVVFVGAFFLIQAGCQATHPNATLGGLLGGTTGGLIGASIGSHEGKAGEGALIGAVAGGITGAALGNQSDQANYRNQQFANQQAIAARQSAVTMDQVLKMTQRGLSDELIVNQINTNGIARRVSTDDIIQLKSQGVSDLVIRQMQSTGARPIPARRLPPGPVIHITPDLPYCQPVPIFRPPPLMWH